jgi:pyruvate kinase
MLSQKRTKIVATIGPSTKSKEVLKNMILEGVNVFRINFSHADYKVVKENISLVRKLSEELETNIAVLADLQGPKLRIGLMEDNTIINPDDTIRFCTGEEFVGNSDKVYMNYTDFPNDVKKGERILVDDGKLLFEILNTNGVDEVKAKVIQGGILSSKKGVNLPNTNLSLPALTNKDKKDALFALEQGVDWIALSFVRNEKDLKKLEKLIKNNSEYKVPIIAKIEKPEGVANIKKIVAYCDGIMVARGDLGVEVPAEEVPLIQKKLVLTAKKARIPVIIATQMMETMIDSLTPTRAEVNDVANSVIDGADAVMLSGETSVGKYPVEVIKKMATILKKVEGSSLINVPEEPPTIRTERYITKSICYHASIMANEIEAKAICTLTNSGYTAFQISAWRPAANILVFTSNKRILSRLSLLWGVNSFYYDRYVSTDETVEDVNQIAFEKGFVSKGDFLINLAAMPIVDKGMVNTLRVSQV